MNDLIGRQAAIDALIGITMFKTKHELMQRVNASVQDEQGWLGAVAECLDEIEDLPSAQPVRHGKWHPCDKKGYILTETALRDGRRWYGYKCSECNDIYHGNALKKCKYCSNCGARMDGTERKE